jgi:hypothetical protein
MRDELPDDRLLTDIESPIKYYQRGVLTSAELINGLFLRFTERGEATTDRARQIVELLPSDIHELFAQQIEEALQPGFLWKPLFFGPGPSRSEEERRAERERYTQLLLPWARALRPLLAATPPAAPRG